MYLVFFNIKNTQRVSLTIFRSTLTCEEYQLFSKQCIHWRHITGLSGDTKFKFCCCTFLLVLVIRCHITLCWRTSRVRTDRYLARYRFQMLDIRYPANYRKTGRKTRYGKNQKIFIKFHKNPPPFTGRPPVFGRIQFVTRFPSSVLLFNLMGYFLRFHPSGFSSIEKPPIKKKKIKN